MVEEEEGEVVEEEKEKQEEEEEGRGWICGARPAQVNLAQASNPFLVSSNLTNLTQFGISKVFDPHHTLFFLRKFYLDVRSFKKYF